MEDKFNMLTMQTYRADFYTGSSYARFVMKQPPVATSKWMDSTSTLVMSLMGTPSLIISGRRLSETQGDDLDYRSFGPNENYWFNTISKINEQRVISTSTNSFVLKMRSCIHRTKTCHQYLTLTNEVGDLGERHR